MTKYCIWHKPTQNIAVNLAGQPLQDLTYDDAVCMMNLIHPQVRDQVEIKKFGGVIFMTRGAPGLN